MGIEIVRVGLIRRAIRSALLLTKLSPFNYNVLHSRRLAHVRVARLTRRFGLRRRERARESEREKEEGRADVVVTCM